MEAVMRAERKLYGLSLIAAPLLLALSTLFWQDGSVGAVGGVIQVYSFLFWFPALLGLLSLLRPTMLRFAVWGQLLVALVCLAGNNFGVEGVYQAALAPEGYNTEQVTALVDAMTLPSLFVFYIPGALFPVTLVLLGFLLWRAKAVTPLLAVLLCLGAIAFPASRIPRIELLAHLADVLLLVAAGGIGWQLLQRDAAPQTAPRAVGAGDD